MVRFSARAMTLVRGGALALLGAGLSVSCSGAFGIAPEVDGGPSGMSDAGPGEAAADVVTLVEGDAADGSTPPCDLDGPFVSIEHVPDLSSSGGEVGLGLTPDGLAAFVIRDSVTDAGYGRHLFVARRASTADPFGAVSEVPGFARPGVIADNPKVSADGNWLALEVGSSNLDIAFVPLVPGKDPDAQLVRPIEGMSTPGGEFDSFLLPDMSALYFVSGGASDRAIFRATLDVTRRATDVTRLSSLSSTGTEYDPVATPDDLTLYFTREVMGRGAEIMVSKRASKSVEHTAAVPVTELLSVGDDVPVEIADRGCTLYFTSNDRKPSKGGNDLYVARKAKR
ncbi:MAG: hypothetical protein IPK71_15330 [Myxococcales bacterium]|nr:hypothetical protein [Myxococcales bacterium]